MPDSATLTLLIGGAFSIVVAVVSGLIANLNARAIARASLNSELGKIAGQIEAQEEARSRQQIDDQRTQFLIPLRYFANLLSNRLVAIERRLASPGDEAELRGWFETIKKHVTADRRLDDFDAWCYYTGIFSITTLYYTFSYFHWANEVRLRRPFGGLRPDFGRELEQMLARVSESFAWENDLGPVGIWIPSQEIIGELFRRNGSQLSYAEMCSEFSAPDAARRAPFFVPVDVYWQDLNVARCALIRSAIDQLVAFIDNEEPNLVRK
jgi:hypothetical protein